MRRPKLKERHTNEQDGEICVGEVMNSTGVTTNSSILPLLGIYKPYIGGYLTG
jgi:hypothetical protein